MNLCGFEVGLDRPFFLVAGPCVVESEQLQVDVAGQLKEITGRLGINFIFKSSFDKANRTSIGSFRGPGMEEGLRVLAEVKRQLGVPLLTDVHEYTPMDEVASVVDVLQTPAFLVRQRQRQQAQHGHRPAPERQRHRRQFAAEGAADDPVAGPEQVGERQQQVGGDARRSFHRTRDYVPVRLRLGRYPGDMSRCAGVGRRSGDMPGMG